MVISGILNETQETGTLLVAVQLILGGDVNQLYVKYVFYESFFIYIYKYYKCLLINKENIFYLFLNLNTVFYVLLYFLH